MTESFIYLTCYKHIRYTGKDNPCNHELAAELDRHHWPGEHADARNILQHRRVGDLLELLQRSFRRIHLVEVELQQREQEILAYLSQTEPEVVRS